MIDPLLRFTILQILYKHSCVSHEKLSKICEELRVPEQIAKLIIADAIDVRDGKICINEYGKYLVSTLFY